MKILKIIVIVMCCNLTMAIVSCADSFIDYQGITSFYGNSGGTNLGPETKETYQWSSISYLIGKNLNSNFDVETSLGVGYLNWNRKINTPTVEWRLLFNIHKSIFYFKIGGGFAHLFENKNLPNLSNADIYGIIFSSIGICIIDSQQAKVTLGYSVEHISSIFDNSNKGDIGLNTGGIRIVYVFKF